MNIIRKELETYYDNKECRVIIYKHALKNLEPNIVFKCGNRENSSYGSMWHAVQLDRENASKVIMKMKRTR